MLTRKTTLWLFILLVLVSACAWFEYTNFPTGGFRSMPASLLPIETQQAQTISLRSTNLFVRCTKAENKWTIEKPSILRADSNRLNFLLDTLVRAPLRDRVSLRQRKNRGLGLGDYGLVTPRAILSITGAGTYAEIHIGNDTPHADCVFVTTSRSSDIFIVDRMILDILPQNVEDLRDHALVPASSQEIGSIEIRRPGEIPIRLEKNNGNWKLTSPLETRASLAAVNAILSSVENATIQKYIWPRPETSAVSQPRTAFGLSLDESVLSATFKYNNGETAVDITFGRTPPESPDSVYVSSSLDQSVCWVDKSILDALKMDPEVLRDHRIIPVQASDIKSLSIQSDTGSFAIRTAEDPSSWTISRPSIQPTDKQAATAFVETLLSLEDISASPLSDADVLKLNRADDAIRIDISHMLPSSPFSAFFFVTRDKNGKPTELSVCVPLERLRHVVKFDKIPADFLTHESFTAIRDKSVIAIPSASLSSISKRTGAYEETVIRGHDNLWFSAKPLPWEANRVTLDLLEKLFANFKSARIETLFTANAASYGLLPAISEFSISTQNAESPVVILLLGNRLPDGSTYLQIKGLDAVFIISPEDAKILSLPLITKPEA